MIRKYNSKIRTYIKGYNVIHNENSFEMFNSFTPYYVIVCCYYFNYLSFYLSKILAL